MADNTGIYLEGCYDSLLQQKELISEIAASDLSGQDPGFDCYIRVSGIVRENENSIIKIQRVLYALNCVKCSFAFVYYYDADSSHMYFGVNARNKTLLVQTLRSVYGVMLSEQDYSKRQVFCDQSIQLKGLIKGSLDKNEKLTESVMDHLVSFGDKRKFAIVVIARPISKSDIRHGIKAWGATVAACEEELTSSVSKESGLTSISRTRKNSRISEYLELATKYYEWALQGESHGLWDTLVKVYGEDNVIVDSVIGVVNADCSNSEKMPEGIYKLPLIPGTDSAVSSFSDAVLVHKIEDIKRAEICSNSKGKYYWMYKALSNKHTSNELAALIELPYKDTFGFCVKDDVSFDVYRKQSEGISLGNIVHEGVITNAEYFIDPNELIRHGLVVGLTGSGKTNSIKSLLKSLWELPKSIPFLVIEPAKSEYWQLYNLGCRDMTVYSLDAKDNHLYINPFECETIDGKRASIQTHIDYVFAAFKASFIMYTPQPYILENAIYRIYEDCGWNIANDLNPYGDIYPTIEQLFRVIPSVVEDMGYTARTRDELISALQARVNSLRLGQKGSILNVRKSCSIRNLFGKNAVIELDAIGDDEVKAFVISMILIKLKEYRTYQSDSQKEIRHFLLIEEAHRLLKNCSMGTGENADPRGNAVEFFCNMLAELRSKGQAFLVADQIPSKLAPDLVDNTNLKIIHRVVSEKERSLIGKSSHMTEDQIESIATFGQGFAAVYSEGDNRPILVKARYANVEGQKLTQEEVHRQCVEINSREMIRNEMRNAPGTCILCPFAYSCDYKTRQRIVQRYDDVIARVEKGIRSDDGNATAIFLGAFDEIREDMIKQNAGTLNRAEVACAVLVLLNKCGLSVEKYFSDMLNRFM